MKQKGKCLVGDPVRIDSYTADWQSVRVHPTIFYRRIDEFYLGYKSVKGLYAEIDMGQFVVIRFSPSRIYLNETIAFTIQNILS
jgi:hypothetical protein